MPNIKSAKKRVKVITKKNQINRSVMSEVKTAIKKFNNAIDTNNIPEAERLLPLTMSVIDSATSKGVLHKNNAANKKSALSKRLSDVKSGKITIVVKKDNKTVAAEKAKVAREAREAIREENAKKKAEKAEAKEADSKGKKKLTAKEAKKAEAIAADKAKTKATKAAKKEEAPAVKEEEPAAKKAAAKKPAAKEEKTAAPKKTAKKPVAKNEEKAD